MLHYLTSLIVSSALETQLIGKVIYPHADEHTHSHMWARLIAIIRIFIYVYSYETYIWVSACVNVCVDYLLHDRVFSFSRSAESVSDSKHSTK